MKIKVERLCLGDKKPGLTYLVLSSQIIDWD